MSSISTLFTVILLNINLAIGIIDKKPDFVKTCKIKEPDFKNCSTNAVQGLFYQFPKGLPEIKLQPLDPLEVPVIKILQGDGPVNVNASLANVSVVGFGKTEVLENHVDAKTHDFYTRLHLPRLRIDGQYVLLGRILVIPIRGHGTCWFEASDLNIDVRSDVNLIKKECFNFFDVKSCHVRFSIGGLRLYMGNLFDGIKALERSTNEYLNANWRPVAESLNPILSRTIEDIMLEILKKVFDNIPADFFIGDLEEENKEQQ